MAIERVDGSEVEFEKIQEAALNVSLFSPNKLVVLNSPSEQAEFVEKIDDLIKRMNQSTELLIVEPKVDKRSSYYKVLKTKTVFKEYRWLDATAVAKWVTSYVSQNGGKISYSDAQLLIDRLGNDQELLKNELDKLILYDPQISSKTIDLLSEKTPQSTVFDLIDAALKGDLARTLSLYMEQRTLKVEPQQIIALLAWQLNVLALVKTAGHLSVEEISSQAKLNPFVVRKSLNLSRDIPIGDLKKIINDMVKLDVRLKTESVDADEALQYFLTSLVSKPF